MQLFEIVSNRPLEEERDAKPVCPFCKSQEVQTGGTMSTLVGYIRGPDMNHKWTECQCDDCHKKFVRESKGPDVVWYTQDGVVLSGLPGCFETYEYQCLKCEGPVHRKHTDLQGNEITCLRSEADETGRLVPQFKTFYFCEVCGHGGEVTQAEGAR